MNDDLDSKIKQDLQDQAKELDTLVDGGLVEYIKIGFDSGFSWVMKMGYVIAIVLSILMIYCGFKFFTVETEGQVFWGVLLMLSFNAQVATKLWIFMQTNRNILSREMRIMELRLKGHL